MAPSGTRGMAGWLTLAGGFVIATAAAVAFSTTTDPETASERGPYIVTADGQSLPGQCRDALASVDRPPTPPGYDAAKKVVFSNDAISRAFTGSDEELKALIDVIGIDRSLSDPFGRDSKALTGALALGVSVQPISMVAYR